MSNVSQRLVQPLADLPQCKPLEVEQIERATLNLGQVFECSFQVRPVHLGSNFLLKVRMAQQSIMQRVDVCTNVKAATRQVRLSIQRSVKGNLNDPGLTIASCGVEQRSLPVHVEKHVLDNFFGLTVVPQNAQGDTQDQPRVTVEQKIESVRVPRLKPGEGLFVTQAAGGNFLRNRNWTRRCAGPQQRQGQCTSLWGRTHASVSIQPGIARQHFIHIRKFEQGTPLVRRRYNNTEKSFTQKA
jgi:hypothetical protein